MSGARMTDATQIRTFLLAGRACFTLVSAKTGKRFTFEVRQVAEGAWRYGVAVLTGPNNETDFVHIGWLIVATDGHLVAQSKKADDPLLAALAFLLRCVDAGSLPDALEFHHAGSCAACGRRLTTPESLARGLGPECAARLGG